MAIQTSYSRQISVGSTSPNSKLFPLSLCRIFNLSSTDTQWNCQVASIKPQFTRSLSLETLSHQCQHQKCLAVVQHTVSFFFHTLKFSLSSCFCPTNSGSRHPTIVHALYPASPSSALSTQLLGSFPGHDCSTFLSRVGIPVQHALHIQATNHQGASSPGSN